jgi:co-chaperonin GroES (HSP10)
MSEEWKLDVVCVKKKVILAENHRVETTALGLELKFDNNYWADTPTATVMAVGPMCTEVKVGDIVIPNWARSLPITIGDVTAAVIEERDIFIVLEDL